MCSEMSHIKWDIVLGLSEHDYIVKRASYPHFVEDVRIPAGADSYYGVGIGDALLDLFKHYPGRKNVISVRNRVAGIEPCLDHFSPEPFKFSAGRRE
jgi:hypothetical protein